jgi:hypothetical protein
LTIRLDNSTGKFGAIRIRPVPVGNEHGAFDDRDGWPVATDAEPQYLAQFISPEFIKTVKRKFIWLECPGARRSVYRTAI